MKKIEIKNKKKAIALTVIVMVGVIVGMRLMASASQGEDITVVPPTTTMQTGDLSQRVTASGITEVADPYSIFIELSQEVKTVHVEVGDYVTEGQLLVTYDIEETKKELERQLREAEITLENAQLSLAEISAPATGTEIIDLQTAVYNAEKALVEAQNTYDEYKTKLQSADTDLSYYKQLYDAGAISKTEYDANVLETNTVKDSQTINENSLKAAELAVEKAKTNLANGQNRLNDTSTLNQYQRQQNSVTSAQEKVTSVKEELNKLAENTYSPISGTVIKSNAVEGQMLTDSTVMMEIADLSNLNLSANVSEYDVAKVKVGQKVELTSDGIENKVYTGVVTKVEPTAVSQGTISGNETVVPIVVHMDSPDELVKPGFSFDMEIVVVDLENVNYIPVSALVKDKTTNEYTVFVVGEDEVLTKRTVEIGTIGEMYVEVVSGLEATETIMSSPESGVEEGKTLSDYITTRTLNKDTGTTTGVVNMGTSMTPMGGSTMIAAPSGGMSRPSK